MYDTDMTPAQSDRLSNIERDIALSIQDRKQMRDDIREIKDSVKGFDGKLDTYMDKLEGKFAKSWVEVAMKRLITIVMGAVVMGVMSIVIVK